jgi:gliding motility-associated lipoprotein GldD
MNRILSYTLILIAVLASCAEPPTPKPRAYARIDLPAPTYIAADGEEWHCPYRFEFSTYSAITVDPRYQDSTCWYNLYYPRYRATLHLTYSQIHNNLAQHIEDSRKLAMKHIGKAAQIEEILIDYPEHQVHGIVYDFKGETASDLQFFATDSTTHFLRGALYFNVHPNKDSLAPVIGFVKRDINHLIQTLSWRDTN